MMILTRTIKISVLLAFAVLSFAQIMNIESVPETNDPEAKSILDKLSAKMDALNAYRVAFTMEMNVPGQEEDVQDGFLLQQKDRFVFDISSQSITANGEAVYVYLKNDNEIQINDPDFGEDGSLLSPAQMMRLYETESFFYAITEVNGSVSKIEFKPMDEYSDYSKLRLSVNTKLDQVERMEIFSKDGSRINLIVNDLLLNPLVEDADFVFDTSLYPNAYVEDLRID